VAHLLWARWREVEVHAVDLAGDYQPRDWPRPFLDRLLAELRSRPDLPPLEGVSGPDHAMAAWLSGRSRGEGLHGSLPPLPPWR
jgi:maleylpyruvate isomerase